MSEIDNLEEWDLKPDRMGSSKQIRARTKNGAGMLQRLAERPLWKKQLRHAVASRKPMKVTLAERS